MIHLGDPVVFRATPMHHPAPGICVGVTYPDPRRGLGWRYAVEDATGQVWRDVQSAELDTENERNAA